MPIYNYECVKCGEVIEVLQQYDDPAPDHCEESMKRVLSGEGSLVFKFKGAGWYETDYKNKGKSNGKGKGKETV